jgi:hypothetical protein
VELEYEYNPEFCHGCKVTGHNFDHCKRWNKEEELMNDKETLLKRKIPSVPKQVFVPVKGGRMQQNGPTNMPVVDQNIATNGNISREKEIINVEDSGVKSINMAEKGNNESSINKDLTLSDAHLEIQQKEPVLTPLSPRTKQLQHDAQLENLNSDGDTDFSDSSSQGSMVKDSHCDDDRTRNAIVVSLPDLAMQGTIRATPPIGGVSSPVPDRVMQDMAFLKESWANMAEAEEEETNTANETAQMEDNLDDGFQVHLSKNQKKAQKKLKYPSKDSYATRSKVAPKPFR